MMQIKPYDITKQALAQLADQKVTYNFIGEFDTRHQHVKSSEDELQDILDEIAEIETTLDARIDALGNMLYTESITEVRKMLDEDRYQELEEPEGNIHCLFIRAIQCVHEAPDMWHGVSEWNATCSHSSRDIAKVHKNEIIGWMRAIGLQEKYAYILLRVADTLIIAKEHALDLDQENTRFICNLLYRAHEQLSNAIGAMQKIEDAVRGYDESNIENLY